MVKDRLAICVKGIEAAAGKIGRQAQDIRLVAVTKNVDVSNICEALDAGVRDIGENRIQEAILKYNSLNKYAFDHGYKLIWHMIGHLQTNKVCSAVEMFDLIHSVDSLRLAREIDKEALKRRKVQDVLLEVKTSPETTKYGFLPEEVAQVAKEIALLKNIKVNGLMTVAPVVDVPEKARPYFKKLKDLFNEINCRPLTVDSRLKILSMGMTDDFEVAVEEGSNMVRIGRGIFGERTK